MNSVWIIKLEGGIPKENDVLGRSESLFKYLSEKGYDVTWFKSSFNHAEHIDEYKKDKIIQVSDNSRVVIVHSAIVYKKNISLSRILFCKISAQYFSKYCKKLPQPDIILSSWPTLSLTQEALKYGKKNHIPVLVDVRDNWPDVFERGIPLRMKSIGGIVLRPIKRKAAKLLSQADGITATIFPELVWACKYAGRLPSVQDRVIFLGKGKVELDKTTMEKNLKKWADKGVSSDSWNICFFSTLSAQLDLDTFINALRIVCERYPDIKLIIGGRGDDESRLKKLYADFPNIVFAGFLNGEEMASLMSISKCGAYCLKNSFGFVDAFSNKAVQYLSAGLPIINSLQGFAKTLLSKTNSGVSYLEGDVADCVKTISWLYEHSSEREQMGINAEKLFKEQFDNDIINKQFEEHLLLIESRYRKE